jgi:hypothetical protein
MKFKKGTSGNPKGRPQGVKDKRSGLRDLLCPHAVDLVQKAVELAKAGDTTALRICIDRLIPPARESPIAVAIPETNSVSACLEAQATIVEAVASGALLPGEGQALSSLIENQRRALETQQLEQRLKVLEGRLEIKP